MGESRSGKGLWSKLGGRSSSPSHENPTFLRRGRFSACEFVSAAKKNYLGARRVQKHLMWKNNGNGTDGRDFPVGSLALGILLSYTLGFNIPKGMWVSRSVECAKRNVFRGRNPIAQSCTDPQIRQLPIRIIQVFGLWEGGGSFSLKVCLSKRGGQPGAGPLGIKGWETAGTILYSNHNTKKERASAYCRNGPGSEIGKTLGGIQKIVIEHSRNHDETIGQGENSISLTLVLF